jgi:hypothetical protein
VFIDFVLGGVWAATTDAISRRHHNRNGPGPHLLSNANEIEVAGTSLRRSMGTKILLRTPGVRQIRRKVPEKRKASRVKSNLIL